MRTKTYRFPPPPVSAVAIAGSTELYAINRIFCVGRNYEAHAKEMGFVADREAPFYFTKAPAAFAASGATVPYPPGTGNFHYEMELVVAMGAPAFRVTADAALAAIFGYGCGLDMTRRDLQIASRDKGRPWSLGKDFESAAILAPLVPAKECGHPSRGAIALQVNGVTRQQADLSMMIHPVASIVADLSKYYHLQAGDVIYTGTPEGVSALKAGDRLVGSIEGLGEIHLAIGPAE